MKVKVGLVQPQHAAPPDNIQIVADATATVGDVAGALAGSDRRQGQFQTERGVTLARAGHGTTPQPLDPEQTLIDSGIQSGSTLTIAYADTVAATRAGAPTVAVLRVLEGRDAGMEFPLRLGSSTIGRAADCEVRLKDPSVSKQHARIIVGARVEVVDIGSSNGVVVGGVQVSRLAVAVGDVIELGDTTVSVVSLAASGPSASTDVAFVRSPRVLRRPVPTPIELPQPPRPRQGVRFPWLMLMVPLLMGGILFWRLQTSANSRGSSTFSLIFILMTPLLMVANFIEQRRQRSITMKEEIAEFESALDTCRRQLADGHEQERHQLGEMHPSLAACLDAVDRHAEVLWSRRPEHPEFLNVRFGLGNIPPHHQAVLPRAGGLPEFRQRSEALAAEYALLQNAPVVGNLRVVGGLGIAGPPQRREGVARAAVAQIAMLHSPAEVVLACLTSSTNRRTWDWVEWLPHTSSAHSPLPNHLSADPGTGTVLLNEIEQLITTRSGGAAARLRGPIDDSDKPDLPAVPSVIVIVDDTAVDIARLTRVAELGPDVGVFVLWIADAASGLPASCRTFAVVDGGSGSVGMVREEVRVDAVAMEVLEASDAAMLARRLAPLVDAGRPVEDESDLPRSVSVVSLLGQEASDDADVVIARWRENQSLVVRDGSPPVVREHASGLRAIVGHAGSEPFAIDLRSQGPHALIGGTTGAGKSEFLQAWVLGLAHAYSPDRVTFLFVDYKGGAAFANCVELPHCVGMVTDLSPYLVRRALRSLRAELHYRERLLNEKGKKDLIDLEKSGDPDCPPSLIIVVDEFAALASEVPDFVEGVVDVAQRGRSLGLHLVLATQRPAGVIKDNIRANTNLRIALRMADESDSLDVLGSSMAAHFPTSIPGRGAAKTGPGRITSFQSAFPGARTAPELETPPIEVTDLDFGGGRQWKLPERPSIGQSVAKDIDRVVTTIRAACARAEIPAPRKPWLDSLAAIYSLRALQPRRDIRIPIGVVDVPDHQSQVIEYYRPDSDGNLLIVGTGGSGKTTALRTLAAASAITPGGGVVHVYGLDFGTGALASLEALPNVGSIINGEDEERIQRLISYLGEVIEERAGRYAGVAAANLDDYRRLANQPQEPRLLILLDGFSNFRTAYETTTGAWLYQRFQRILLDGRAVGVHVAMTADRPAAVPGSVMSAFQRRIVLRQADEDAYLSMGVPRDVLNATSPAGRAIWEETGQEMQIAVLLSDEHVKAAIASAAAQVAAIDQLGVRLAEHHTRPPAVQSLPSLVNAAALPTEVRGRPALGIADTTLAPIGFDPAGVIMVAGPPQSGRTNAVRWLATSLRRRWPDLRIVHLSTRRSPLSGLDLWTQSADHEEAVKAVLESLDALGPITPAASPDAAPPMALVVEYLPDFVGSGVEQPLLKRIQAMRRAGCPVIAEAETPAWTSSWPLTMEIRNGRTGLLLQPDQADGESLLRTALPRIRRADFPAGRGFWVKGGAVAKVQLPLVEE
ncbi:FHA domain-containing protein [Nocardioides humilatus]|uniref:FHA domain-containing protein n=1 Tax=Nocardioides humilatus TaxID=2607660 RepID=A0A5B1LLG4_9ACTN|nr:FtsK/SpoIIIE domain-containing protein [Nocardioides humilatus]KAA1421552.1 FHA domain-containing protein [Nocardioides humilatus]